MARKETQNKSRTCVHILGYMLILCVVSIHLFCSLPRTGGLMDWEEYKRMPNGFPYICRLDLEKGGLVYFGAIHTINPDDPQVSAIEELWNEFQPDLAFCESCLWPLENTGRGAVRKYGEQGRLCYLANRDGVSIKRIDPPQKITGPLFEAVFHIR